SAARVRRLGVLDGRQKRDFFAGLDVFALPSRSDSFGLVLLEAWANGVPNAAYRAGGVAGGIRAREDGLLVRCGDADVLAGGVEGVATEGGGGRGLGQGGWERTRREFRWEDKLRRVREVYEETTSRLRLSGATR